MDQLLCRDFALRLGTHAYTMSSTSPALRIHQRLQRWRRRERVRYPGLFASSLNPPVSPPQVILQRLRNGRCKLLISGVSILLCDGCGALLSSPPESEHAESSASTLPPAGSANESRTFWIICDRCRFCTPIGTLRRLLDLSDDRGPALDAEVAQALLVEALGAPSTYKLQDKWLREWILDTKSRMEGLDALCGALGLRDEQLDAATVFNDKHETIAMTEAERFLEKTVPSAFMNRIPLSVIQIRAATLTTKCALGMSEAQEAAERTKNLVTEAVRMWQNAISSNASGGPASASFVLKLRALGKEYLIERTQARSYNLVHLHIPQKGQVTQPKQQLSHTSGGDPRDANPTST